MPQGVEGGEHLKNIRYKSFVLSTALIAVALFTTACFNSADKQAGSTLDAGGTGTSTPQEQETKRVEVSQYGISFHVPDNYEVVESYNEVRGRSVPPTSFAIQRIGEEYEGNVIRLSIVAKGATVQSNVSDPDWSALTRGTRTVSSRRWKYEHTRETQVPYIELREYVTEIGEKIAAFDFVASEGEVVYQRSIDVMNDIMESFDLALGRP